MNLTVYNDVHIGVQRSAGTTPLTAWTLRQSILTQFADLMDAARGDDVMILGDLFDSASIPMADWLRTFQILHEWLEPKSGRLYLVAGNHDLSKTDTTLSSFQLLCKVLQDLHPDRVGAIFTPTQTPYGHVIPHLPNQDLFDAAIAAVPNPCTNLFLHCNYSNNFAAQADQSLNLTQEQAAACPAGLIVIAHEHQTRKQGKVWIPGNQIVSSISDCLHTQAKQHFKIVRGVPSLEVLYPVHEVYEDMSWSELRDSEKPFIRISGSALATEAADVVRDISNYRKNSNAFIVSNAVKILAEDGSDVFAKSLESVKSFDVMAALRAFLTAEEYAVVEKLT